MKVYAIFKEGVYRHECGGIFSTLEKAKDAAKSLISGEDDDYHTYKVLAFDLDVCTPQISKETETNKYSVGDLIEPACLSYYWRAKSIIILKENE